MKKTSIPMLALLALALLAALPALAGEAAAADAGVPAAAAPADCAAPAAAGSGAEEPLFLAGQICGSKICGKGTYCCNASCSLCVRFDMSCTQQVCSVASQAQEAEREEVTHFLGGQPCNQVVCGQGQFCCNHSCSICAPRGGACTQQICAPTS